MKVLTGVLLMLGIVSIANASFTADGRLEDWGTWSNGSTDLQFGAGAGVEFATTWSLTDNIITEGEPSYGSYFGPNKYPGVYSGGEKFDIEGLYVDLVTDSNSGLLTDIRWAMVTSYKGLGADYYNKPPSDFRFSPVLALDLNGDSLYEWGLVLDAGDGWTGSAYTTTGYNAAYNRYSVSSIDTTAQLWQIAAPALGDAWRPAASEFGFGQKYYVAGTDPVMFTTNQEDKAKLVLTGDAGESVRRRAQWFNGTSYVNYTESWYGTNPMIHVDPWEEDENWIWEGTLNVSGIGALSIPAGATASVHYTMYCGNDWVTAQWTNKSNEITTLPEPSMGVLLLLAMLPVGAVWRRRKGL